MKTVWRPVRIASRTVEAVDICSFDLVDPKGGALPPFTAGAHIDVRATNDIVRSYSLCNAPGETHRYQIAVLRDAQSRGGSAAMHALEAGQLLEISEPRNHFALADGAACSLLIAGGIGITPLLCMAEQLSRQHAPFALHYSTRSAGRTAFAERLRASAFASSVHFHHDDGAEAQKFDLRATLAAAPSGSHLYVCGPTGFMDAVLAQAREFGWPEDRLHREYFAAALVDTREDGSFEVQIASTGALIRVAAEQSVLAALAGAGFELPSSCEQGVCGTCLTRVLSGTPLHRDLYLTPQEQARNDQFTPCCSRASSARLVLDL